MADLWAEYDSLQLGYYESKAAIEDFPRRKAAARKAIEDEVERAALEKYSGIINVIDNAKGLGVTLHVATRATCAEHIEAGDDKPEAHSLLNHRGNDRG
jgi:hypothetical protein